jgi:hypothetical protein
MGPCLNCAEFSGSHVRNLLLFRTSLVEGSISQTGFSRRGFRTTHSNPAAPPTSSTTEITPRQDIGASCQGPTRALGSLANPDNQDIPLMLFTLKRTFRHKLLQAYVRIRAELRVALDVPTKNVADTDMDQIECFLE